MGKSKEENKKVPNEKVAEENKKVPDEKVAEESIEKIEIVVAAKKKPPNEAFKQWRELVELRTGIKGVLRSTHPKYDEVKAEYNEMRAKQKAATAAANSTV